MPVTLLVLVYDLIPGNIGSRKKGRRTMPKIVMSITFQIPKTHGERWLTALQGLILTLFVHPQNERVGRRIKIETNDVSDFFYQERRSEELETPAPVRVEPKRDPDPLDGGLPYPRFRRKVPAVPMGAVLRLGIDGLFEQLSDFLGSNASMAPRTQFVMEPLDALPDEPPSPFPESNLRYLKFLCNRVAVLSFGGQKYNLHTGRYALRHRTGVRPRLQLFTLLARHLDFFLRTTCAHGLSPPAGISINKE